MDGQIVKDPIKVFVSSSSFAEDKEVIDRFLLQARPSVRNRTVMLWHATREKLGSDVTRAKETKLLAADIVLVLVSPDYFTEGGPADSELEQIYNESRRRSALRIIPIVLTACTWDQDERLNGRTSLPRDGLPIKNEGKIREEVISDIWRDICQQANGAPGEAEAAGGVKKMDVIDSTPSTSISGDRGRMLPGYSGWKSLTRVKNVYETWDEQNRRMVAIKFLDLAPETPPFLRDRFLDGVKLQAQCDSPFVAPVYRWGEDRGEPYVVMDRAASDLKTAVLHGLPAETRRLTRSEIRQICLDVGEGVIYLHDKGWSHKCIRPTNILLFPEGDALKARISDFDLVGYVGPLRSEYGDWKKPYSASRLRSCPADPSGDVYSLAVTIVFCLFGNVLQELERNDLVWIIRDLDCGDSLRKLLEDAISPDSSAELRSARGFKSALLGLSVDQWEKRELVRSDTADVSCPAKRPRRKAMVLGGGGVFMLFLTAVWAAWAAYDSRYFYTSVASSDPLYRSDRWPQGEAVQYVFFGFSPHRNKGGRKGSTYGLISDRIDRSEIARQMRLAISGQAEAPLNAWEALRPDAFAITNRNSLSLLISGNLLDERKLPSSTMEHLGDSVILVDKLYPAFFYLFYRCKGDGCGLEPLEPCLDNEAPDACHHRQRSVGYLRRAMASDGGGIAVGNAGSTERQLVLRLLKILKISPDDGGLKLTETSMISGVEALCDAENETAVAFINRGAINWKDECLPADCLGKKVGLLGVSRELVTKMMMSDPVKEPWALTLRRWAFARWPRRAPAPFPVLPEKNGIDYAWLDFLDGKVPTFSTDVQIVVNREVPLADGERFIDLLKDLKDKEQNGVLAPVVIKADLAKEKQEYRKRYCRTWNDAPPPEVGVICPVSVP